MGTIGKVWDNNKSYLTFRMNCETNVYLQVLYKPTNNETLTLI